MHHKLVQPCRLAGRLFGMWAVAKAPCHASILHRMHLALLAWVPKGAKVHSVSVLAMPHVSVRACAVQGRFRSP